MTRGRYSSNPNEPFDIEAENRRRIDEIAAVLRGIYRDFRRADLDPPAEIHVTARTFRKLRMCPGSSAQYESPSRFRLYDSTIVLKEDSE